MKKIITLFIIFCLFGCASEKNEVIPDKENIAITNAILGRKNTNIKPVILINEGEDTLYIGEKDYKFDVEAYSDNGKVEIIFDDSGVDFEKEGTYEINVFAKDIFDENTDITNLTLKKKVVKQTISISNENSTSGSTSNNSSSGGRLTCLGYFNTYAEFAAYAEAQYAIGLLSDRFINEVRNEPENW